jgi:hypothetical protein
MSLAVKSVFAVLKRLPGAGKINLTGIMANQTTVILNLPGSLPFFPTKVTSSSRIINLLRLLHPIRCSKGLVRLGSEGDGGYLVPDDLEGIVACFSPGVSDNAGFELDLAERGMQIFLADASVGSPPVQHGLFHFRKKFVGATTGGDFLTMEDWVESSMVNEQGDLLLQMDIEGFEYETLLAMPERVIRRFRIIVIEFHFLDRLFSEPSFEIQGKTFEKLLLTHTCLHIHPNNVCGTIRVGQIEIPQMAEYTFLRNDRVSDPVFATEFPHPLDVDNVPGEKVILPQSCFRRKDG